MCSSRHCSNYCNESGAKAGLAVVCAGSMLQLTLGLLDSHLDVIVLLCDPPPPADLLQFLLCEVAFSTFFFYCEMLSAV